MAKQLASWAWKMSILHELAPQMRDYDHPEIAKLLWVPYVMYHCGFPGAATTTCNLDLVGCRIGASATGAPVSMAALMAGDFADQEVDLFVGGSTAFGVGASSDQMTIPSLLSRQGTTTINLGMRSWVLQQNLIHLLFLNHRVPSEQKIRRVYLFGGYNELNCAMVSNYNTRPFGPMYGWSRYFENMNNEYLDKSGDFGFPADVDQTIVPYRDLSDKKTLLMCDIDSVFAGFAALMARFNAQVWFVLQPVAAWLSRVPSLEEEKLFCERARWYPHEAELFAQERTLYEGWYSSALRTLCSKHRFEYADANHIIAKRPLDKLWLFVDPWHLTDLGTEILVEQLKEESIV